MKHSEEFCLTTLVVWFTLICSANAACECGRPRSYYDPGRRIVNGEHTRPHEYPWMALILHRNMAQCGGSVINNYYILTAAHCMPSGWQVDDMSVVLGVHDRITMDDGRAQIYKVLKAIIHPSYKPGNSGVNDIALFRVDKEIKFSYKIRPICLPCSGEDFSERAAIVAGWGKKRYGARFTNRYLHQVILKVLTREQCERTAVSGILDEAPSQLLCVYERDVGSCQGDSGGPLVTSVDKHFMVQIGIVSGGRRCGESGSPSIYVKVSYFVKWIFNETRGAKWCQKPRFRRTQYVG